MEYIAAEYMPKTALYFRRVGKITYLDSKYLEKAEVTIAEVLTRRKDRISHFRAARSAEGRVIFMELAHDRASRLQGKEWHMERIPFCAH